MKRAFIVIAALALGWFRPSMFEWHTSATEPSPVTVQLISPVEGSIVSNTITLSALAETTAPNSSIYKVEFYVDGKLVGTVTNQPTAPVIDVRP